MKSSSFKLILPTPQSPVWSCAKIKTQSKNSPLMCYISSKNPSLKWNGDPIYIITGIEVHGNGHSSCQYLDQPLFINQDGFISPTNNPIINIDDCNPNFLLTFADLLTNGDIPYPEAIRSQAVNNIRDVFLNKVTPRAFYERIREHTNVIFKDDSYPETYRLDGELFYESMATRNILAFDVHDLVHHPLQLVAWPDQFKFVTQAGLLASRLPNGEKKTIRLRKLTGLVWLACFEESLIMIDNQLVSFGCLNWLSPSETPLDKIPDIRKATVQDQKIGFLWHYFDAFKDMYRIGMADDKLMGEELHWVEKLGYSIDESLKKLIESDDPRPFENLDYYDVLKFNMKAPKSPDELFANAMNLIQEEL